MNNPSTQAVFVPTISTQAGSTLTTENWWNAGIQTISCSLASLLMKPGYDFLMKLNNIADFVSWPGAIALDADLPRSKKNNTFNLRSVYDGRIIRHSWEEIGALIRGLQPDMVILPELTHAYESLSATLPGKTLTYYPTLEIDRTVMAEGRHFHLNEAHSLLNQPINQNLKKPNLISGNFDWMQIKHLATTKGAVYIESDRPAADALTGLVYTENGHLAITDRMFENAFEKIESNCGCSTCKQDFTRAYLHHLFLQTPLLCHRLLIQHNIYFTQTRVQALSLS